MNAPLATPQNITLASLRVEHMLAADEATRAVLEAQLPTRLPDHDSVNGAERCKPAGRLGSNRARRTGVTNVRAILVKTLSALLLTAGFTVASSAGSGPGLDDDALVGAWRSRVQFTSGAFATVKDLELMYAFNAGGTMTESSNYDASPPVPPAYGVWRKVQAGQYEARYSFYVTRPPQGFEDIARGGGWSPAGIGVIVEKIVLAADGRTYTSTLQVDILDQAGRLVESGSEAVGRGSRMEFESSGP